MITEREADRLYHKAVAYISADVHHVFKRGGYMAHILAKYSYELTGMVIKAAKDENDIEAAKRAVIAFYIHYVEGEAEAISAQTR